MLSQRPKQAAYVQGLVDVLLLCLAFAAAFHVRSNLPLPILGPPIPIAFATHFWMLAIVVPLYWALTRSDRPYAAHYEKALGLRQAAVPYAYLGLLLGTAIFLFQAKHFSRAVFFLFLVFGFTLTTTARSLWRLGHRRLQPAAGSRKKLLIVGLGPDALQLRRKIESRPEYHIEVVGHLAGPHETPDAESSTRVLGRLEELEHVLDNRVIDDVVFAVPPGDLPACATPVAWCEQVGVTVHLKVDFVRALFAKTFPSELHGTHLLTLSTIPHDPAALLLKRGLDVAVALAALVALAPLFLLAAAAIKLGSRGPVIFSQQRIGLNGRLFRLYKFRSMCRDAEAQSARVAGLNELSGPVFKTQRDPRVTAVGRLLRRTSIDELPQLWNVLRGDMSLVGPRPLPDDVGQSQRSHRRRLSMKPGLTCLWQVNGRSRIPFEDWMRLDLEYIDNWSLLLDLKILLRTVPAVVLSRGAW
jgi:exopolysaccharide biosynthesis polyprenyl glycosylphosphotransferase